jgi:hypothetical protein
MFISPDLQYEIDRHSQVSKWNSNHTSTDNRAQRVTTWTQGEHSQQIFQRKPSFAIFPFHVFQFCMSSQDSVLKDSNLFPARLPEDKILSSEALVIWNHDEMYVGERCYHRGITQAVIVK